MSTLMAVTNCLPAVSSRKVVCSRYESTVCKLLNSINQKQKSLETVWNGFQLCGLLYAFISGVGVGFGSTSGCIAMRIAVERCLCVVLLLKAATFISSRSMAVIRIPRYMSHLTSATYMMQSYLSCS